MYVETLSMKVRNFGIASLNNYPLLILPNASADINDINAFPADPVVDVKSNLNGKTIPVKIQLQFSVSNC